MTTSTRSATGPAFEADVQAMLTRRAADVRPAPASSRHAITRRLATSDEGSGATGGTIIYLHEAPAGGRRRWIAAVAAALALAAGAVGLVAVTTGDGTDTTTTGPAASTPGTPTVIWPLAGNVPAEELATPEAATRAYLSDVAGITSPVLRDAGGDPQAPPLGRVDVGPDRAVVRYMFSRVRGTVSLIQRDGSWHVTGATNDAVVIDQVSGPDGDFVDVEVVRGPDTGVEPLRLRADLVNADGRRVDTADVAFEDGEPIASSGPPLATGSWHTQLFVTTGSTPIAVRVDVLSSNFDTDAVLAHASVPVPGATDAREIAAPTTTTAPHVDPDPDPLPPGPDQTLALGPLGDVEPGTRGLTGWKPTASALMTVVTDTRKPTGTPTFTDVVKDSDALTVQGRYSMPDGDTGTFELTRLDDGRWGMLSVRSDAIELREVGRAGSRVQVTLVSAKDAELGVGGGELRAGRAPGEPSLKAREPWVEAGKKAVFSLPCRESRAQLIQFLDADDGTNIRVYEAWPC